MLRSQARYLNIVFLLLFVNAPNPYIGTLLLFLSVFFLGVKNKFHFKVSKFEKELLKYWMFIFSIMLLAFCINYSSFNNLFWGVFTFAPIILVPFMLVGVENKEIIKALKVFTVIQIFFMLYQLVNAMFFFHTFNIYTASHGAVGDGIAGTSIGFSSVISVTMFIISLVFLRQAKEDNNYYKWFVISAIMGFLPSYTAANLVFLFSPLVYFVFKTFRDVAGKGKISLKMIVLMIFMMGLFAVFVVTQWSNILYASRILEAIFSLSPPNKVVAYMDVISKFPEKYPSEFILGTGFGNYSSRAAFIVSGNYLLPQPSFIPITPSLFFLEFMDGLFNIQTKAQVLGNVIGTSMVNAPFSQIITFIGEGGIASLILFILILYKGITRYYNDAPICIGILFFGGIMFLDNWLAFPNVAVLFWIVIKYMELTLRRN